MNPGVRPGASDIGIDLGTTRVFERDGNLWITIPRRAVRLWDLRAGDVVRWRKMPRQTAWRLTFYRRGRQLLPSGTFSDRLASTMKTDQKRNP